MDTYGECTIITNNKQTIKRTLIFQSEYILYGIAYIYRMLSANGVASWKILYARLRNEWTFIDCNPDWVLATQN